MDFVAKDRLNSTRLPAALRPLAAMPATMVERRRSFLKGSAGVLLMAGFGSMMLSACGGAGDASMAAAPSLASADNFRDVAGIGEGYQTVDGRRVRRGMFYRANVLALSAADQATLGTLGLTAVYDLRTPGEIARTPDALPVGVSYVTINIAGTDDVQMPPLTSSADAVALQESNERSYVTGGAQRAGYATLLNQLA
ncbi:MAG: tyrosine-protein phosphatase, partial [Paraburkholderia sp.]|nr:tyrosine-protein phosphatase [Paraburkholderia sp.]